MTEWTRFGETSVPSEYVVVERAPLPPVVLANRQGSCVKDLGCSGLVDVTGQYGVDFDVDLKIVTEMIFFLEKVLQAMNQAQVVAGLMVGKVGSAGVRWKTRPHQPPSHSLLSNCSRLAFALYQAQVVGELKAGKVESDGAQ